MPGFAFSIGLFFSLLLLFSPAFASAAHQPTATPTIPAVKIFSLNHKDVVAVAVEVRLPAGSIADPLTYSFDPQYQLTQKADSITLTIDADPDLASTSAVPPVNSSRLLQLTTAATTNTFTLTATYHPQAGKPSLTLVKRKRVLQPDNTLAFRTYLVLSFADAAISPPKTIVLDAGHGGSALGATSNTLVEKDLNLDIALLSRDLFRQHGYDVYMTRTDDSNPGLLDRADAANILQADVFLSIHNNSIPTDMPDAAKKLYRGTTALYNAAAPKPAKELAQLLADELSGTLRIHQYPLQDRPNLVVLNSTWVPAVIAEVAMMPHPQDAKMLSQRVYRQQAAEAVFRAVENFFSLMPAKDGRRF
ncbi:MAG: lytC 2 [Firmicutes bacterium]|nr:lytC 2 [Bacillota bacterium]